MTEREYFEQRLAEKLARELGPCVRWLNDPDVTEIICNEDGAVWIETVREGLIPTADSISPAKIEALIGTVANAIGAVANAANPIIEAELPLANGRFEGVMPPVVAKPVFVIRKPASRIYTLEEYVKAGIITIHQRVMLESAIDARKNILIAGAVASGKTTLANALIAEIDADKERIILIEDTYELQCAAFSTVHLHTTDEVSLRRLVRTAMRLRPDRIIVGETRGAEALDMLKAWNTGTKGGITTIHANSAEAALIRLDSLTQEANVPPQQRLISEAIDLICFIEKTNHGRRVTEIAEVTGFDGQKINLRPKE